MANPGRTAEQALLRLLENEREVARRDEEADADEREALDQATRQAEALVEEARSAARAKAKAAKEAALERGRQTVAEKAEALEAEIAAADATARANHESAVAVVTDWVTAQGPDPESGA